MPNGGFHTKMMRHGQQILPDVIQKRFRTLHFQNGDYINTRADLEPGAIGVLREEISHVGAAAIIADSGSDIPIVDASGSETSAKVLTLKSAYSYLIEELERAEFAGFELTRQRAMGARRALAELENQIAAYGSSAHGVSGLINNDLVPLEDSSFDFFDTGNTIDDILQFFLGQISEVESASNLTEKIGDVLLPAEVYNKLVSLRVPGTSSTSLKFLESALAEEGESVRFRKVSEIEAPKLEAHGVRGDSTKHRVILYNRSEIDTHDRHTEPLRVLELEGPLSSRYTQPFALRTTGVLVNHPYSFRYVDVPVSS